MKVRALLSVLILSALTLPCLAQNVLKSEPLVLAPYEIAYVQDVSCPAGKVLKVTGAIRGLHRKKACVTLASDQASLAVAAVSNDKSHLNQTMDHVLNMVRSVPEISLLDYQIEIF